LVVGANSRWGIEAVGNKCAITVRFDAEPDRLIEAAGYAFTKLKLRSVKWSAKKRVLSGRTPMTARSFGEKLAVTMSNRGEVAVKSRCLIPTTLVDYGKNEENCEHLVAVMRASLAKENPESVSREFLAIAAKRNKQTLMYAVLFGIIVSVCGVFGGIVAVRMLNPSIDSQIAAVCRGVSKQCPLMADRYTRLDSCVSGTGKQIIYAFTIVELKIPDADKIRVYDEIREIITNQCRSTPDTKKLLDQGVTLTYRYYDEKGMLLTEFDVK
jgi:hypothetical protein